MTPGAGGLALAVTIAAAGAGLAPKDAPDGRFVLVRGGSFQMGDLWGDSPWAMPEAPPREVQLGDFLLARHETTVSEFARFVAATGYRSVAEEDGPEMLRRMRRKDPTLKDTGRYPYWREHDFVQGPHHPAVMIAWEDAVAYCNWLSRHEGLPPAYDGGSGRFLAADGRPTSDVREAVGYRLPTEAEWEFAARERGRKVRFGNGRDVARSSEMNFDAAGTGQTVPSLRQAKDGVYPYSEKGLHRKATTAVGTFAPNALGLYDMSGNAWEWTSDTGGEDYPTGKRPNPCAPGGSSHVLRGGDHDTDAKACRASARIDWGARSYCFGSGFRVARTALSAK